MRNVFLYFGVYFDIFLYVSSTIDRDIREMNTNIKKKMIYINFLILLFNLFIYFTCSQKKKKKREEEEGLELAPNRLSYPLKTNFI
jgi:hypothetical protein